MTKKEASESVRVPETASGSQPGSAGVPAGHFRLLADLSPDWIYWMNPDKTAAYCSPSCETLTGYPPEAFLSDPDLFFSLIHPEDQVHFNSHFSHADTRQKAGSCRFRILTRSGEVKWIEHTCTPVLDGDGQFLGMRGNNRDVSTVRKTESELEQKEEFHRALFDAANDLISVYTLDGRFIYLNPAVTALLGYTPEEASRLSVMDIIPPEHLEAASRRRDNRKNQNTDTYRYEIDLFHRDGRRIPFDVNSSVFKTREGDLLNLSIARDISDQKAAEKLLVEAEEKYRSLVDNLQEGIFRCTTGGRLLMANPAFYRILKLPVQEADFPSVLCHYEDPQARARLMDLLETDGHATGFVSRVSCRDGSKIWISENIRLIRSADGTADYLEGTLTDITGKIETEERLREIITEFGSLTEAIPDAIFFKDSDGRWLIINSAAKALFRLDDTAWQGKTDRELADLDPEFRAVYDACIQSDQLAWKTGHRIDVVETLADETGQTHYFDTTKIPLFDGGKPVGLVIIGRDTTLQRMAGERIQEQGFLLDHASDAIIVTDLNRNIQYWNKGAENLYGWALADVIGQNFEKLTVKSDPGYTGTEIPGSQWVGELVQFSRGGEELITESRQNWILGPDGKAKSILYINSDITERKKLERQFLRSQRMESIGRMASGIAHDLNNILSPILISVQRFSELHRETEHQKWIQLLETNVNRAAGLMKQLLMFSRGAEGTRILVRPEEILREIEKIVRSTFPKNITIICRFADELWPVFADSTQIHQLLLNLCVNARDAMPEGGTLTLEAENVVFHEDYVYRTSEGRPGNYILIKVSDTGTGIPQGIIDRIFDPFFTTKDLDKGTGLGLSTAAAITKSHNGLINVYSEPGFGAQFKVYLPAVGETVSDLAEETARIAYDGKGAAVLVVDDEEPILSMLSAVLADYNYTVLTATDGIQAIGMFTSRPDIRVVISDVNMPKMDGPTLIRTLKAIRPEIDIIATSGLTDRDITRDDVRQMIRCFLQKPYRTELLLAELHQIISD